MTNELPQTTEIEEEHFIEPNWEALKLMMEQAMNYMWRSDASDAYGSAELETVTMAHNVLFSCKTDEARFQEIAFRVRWIQGWGRRGELLEEMLKWPMERLRI